MPDECTYVRAARVSRGLSRSLFVRTFLLGGEGWPLIDLSLSYYHPHWRFLLSSLVLSLSMIRNVLLPLSLKWKSGHCSLISTTIIISICLSAITDGVTSCICIILSIIRKGLLPSAYERECCLPPSKGGCYLSSQNGRLDK